MPLPLRRAATVAAFLMVFLGVFSDALFLAAFQFRLDWFLDPPLAVAGGSVTADLLYWGGITDLFSYYLPLAPIALAFWVGLRGRPSVVLDAAVLSGFGFVIIGSIGAITVAFAAPDLVRAYADGGASQAAAAVAFTMLVNIVFGFWQALDLIFFGVFFLGIGWLMTPRHRGFGRVGEALGAAALAGAAVTILGLDPLRFALLGVVFVLWFVWAAWLGVLLLRDTPLAADGPGA
jgi:hypothetical protein